MNKANKEETIKYENMRIKAIVSNNDHDTAVSVIQTNYRIYINALKSLRVGKKSSVVRPNWIVTILLYRKLLKSYGLPFGACSV